MLTETTLVLLKPDAVARGLAGRILQRFEDAGLKIAGVKMVLMDAELTARHYADLEKRFGAAVYAVTASFMQSGPVIALALEGVGAVANTRRLIGTTFPDQSAPGTIRGDYAHMSREYAEAHDLAVANLVHASGSPSEAKYEIDLWFGEAGLHQYRAAADPFVR
ncbi:nucleoside-diphosphate kinase [Actinoplanes solisilvae]|uniref:nucleoside-diphosphate kinase n=1 Tax=Actinoplanes solisilvae TaxID=2486853 RepID=UPI000FD7552F|nr:nucleoside-diphosphate kinase [Actinoplanes solisilvae]